MLAAMLFRLLPAVAADILSGGRLVKLGTKSVFRLVDSTPASGLSNPGGRDRPSFSNDEWGDRAGVS